MIDIGANLANESFSSDLPAVLERALQHQVEKIIVTGSSVASSHAALALAQSHPGLLYATAGLHPHAADDFDASSIDQFQRLCAEPEVVAIGETGLDFNRNYSSQANQLRSFEAHLALADSIHKPLFLHERDAFDSFYAIIRKHPSLCERAIVHCFTGDQAALKAYLDLGLRIGITGWICDKKRGAELRQIISYAPLERLMIETDAPYLIPHREQLKNQLAHKHRNEPWTLGYTASALAEAMSIELAEVKNTTRENALRFFGL